MVVAEEDPQEKMRSIRRQFKKNGLQEVKGTKGEQRFSHEWMTTLATARCLYEKFLDRWGVEPTQFRFIDSRYVALGPIPA